MIHNSWTHQPNVQSNPPEDDFDEQKQRYIHDIFANSNERPISAPPSSSDDVNVSCFQSFSSSSVIFMFPLFVLY